MLRVQVSLLTLLLGIGCGGSAPQAVAAPAPSRQMNIAMSGALNGPFQVTVDRVAATCGGSLAKEPQSLTFSWHGRVTGAGDDLGVELTLGVHRYSKPGRFKVGPYPAGTPVAPAIVSLVREITPRNIVSWVSGSGEVLIDFSARSGTMDVNLNSAEGAGGIAARGSWTCT